MVYAWSQTPRSIGSKKTCSTWPSDSSLSSRNRGRNILETGGKSNCVKGRCCLSGHWGEPFGFQVQACAEVWHVLRGELLKRRPVASRSGGADGHRTEPTPPAVSWSVVFLCLNELLNNLFPGLWFVFFSFFVIFPNRCNTGPSWLCRSGPGTEQYREHQPGRCESSAVPLQRALWGQRNSFSSRALQSCNSYMKKGHQLLWSGASLVLVKTRYNS